ncbi:hypothetical protein A2291_03745 [candidate division WOR-1 bacterium RIFOXYB2_FULL_42_35]|uniref:Uncharacterized protein n=1 Tax=candidate division WOR-1 bacterium RIFOXYC2_FULL_41_25 TaxID=1802586 RepID=A0A1F4TQU4_UNCSA|nr:MAG: hypothetical protein A2291_03745 [candidate division WOR-1 bacterium RIFOXYB2_FULL_42_35]OGC35007.1 MAG: hypothetical protein A2462_05375 [candidate division WOR-1 bacterium RIFOXYC2_FULL_41_25]OGC44201.1 MAG: hypothetical protein A2548_02885 [candidate division WOR-1 bacterium RIFOXYD2_FULL_41_8]
MLKNIKTVFSGFGKAGEKVSQQDGVYTLEGEGTDIGCNIVLLDEMPTPSLLEFEVRGKLDKKEDWTRLRVEIFDCSNLSEAATSYEDDYLTVDLDPKNFKHMSFPILGIVKKPHRVQFMVVGPSHSRLEIKNVCLR